VPVAIPHGGLRTRMGGAVLCCPVMVTIPHGGLRTSPAKKLYRR